MTDTKQFFWKARLRASGIHLAASLGVALLAGVLVFGIWYPYPYRETSGGRELFLLLVGIDVILGPLITLSIFNLKKPRTELIRDLSLVVLVQLAALAYGLWTVAAARPVHLVFEFDRFRVVHAIDVAQELVGKTSEKDLTLPLLGPTMLAVRPFKDPKEKLETTMAALQGVSLAARPDLWQAYSEASVEVLNEARPIAELKHRFPQQLSEINAAVHRSGQAEATLVFLPMVDRASFWTVLLDNRSAEVRGFIPIDSF